MRFLVSCYPCVTALGKASVYTNVAGVLMLLATLVNMVAVATPYWEYVVNDMGESHSGLWWVCFMGMCDQFIKHPLFSKSSPIAGLFISAFTH